MRSSIGDHIERKHSEAVCPPAVIEHILGEALSHGTHHPQHISSLGNRNYNHGMALSRRALLAARDAGRGRGLHFTAAVHRNANP